MKYCGRCGERFPMESEFCPRHGTRLHVSRESVEDPLIGQTLVGRYQVISRVGAGAMGTVYRARNVHAGIDVALKTLNTGAAARNTVIERFTLERDLIAQHKVPPF